jgi:hypothetical protein
MSARQGGRRPAPGPALGGLLAVLIALGPALLAAQPGGSREERFRGANELARAGDYPKAIAGYEALAAAGGESASLYWNWAQAAAARGAQGEALWALLRARELDPGDRAVNREVDRVREALNLDPAEIAPEPLAAVARASRRFHLDLVALALLAASLVAHALARLAGFRGGRPLGTALAVLAVVVAVVPIAGSLARATAGVVRRGAPLYDAASPTAEAAGSLREGEVVPILEATGEWLRVEDNAGARGWARAQDVRPLDRPPHPRD